MTWFLDADLGAAAVGLATGAFVRQVIAHLPEPAAVDQDDDEPKRLYDDIAAHPGLRWRTAASGAVAAGLLGARIGWDPALLFGLYLVPVCVALARQLRQDTTFVEIVHQRLDPALRAANTSCSVSSGG